MTKKSEWTKVDGREVWLRKFKNKWTTYYVAGQRSGAACLALIDLSEYSMRELRERCPDTMSHLVIHSEGSPVDPTIRKMMVEFFDSMTLDEIRSNG